MLFSSKIRTPWFQLLSSCFSVVLLPNPLLHRWQTMATSQWTASFLSENKICISSVLISLWTILFLSMLSQFSDVFYPVIYQSLHTLYVYTILENVGKAIIEADKIFWWPHISKGHFFGKSGLVEFGFSGITSPHVKSQCVN